MKAEEKQLIFNLLKTADTWNSGYLRPKFATNPDFKDDQTAETENKIEESASETEIKIQPQVQNKNGLSIAELEAKILRCTRCSLARTRNSVISGEGVENPLVLVIGEGPGVEEDLKGKPFVGKTGLLLDKMLSAIQLDRKTNCYITNIVKCRPPEDRRPFPDEISSCFSFLETQIHLLKPKMILCMGKSSCEKLINQTVSIENVHGNFYDYNGIPVMPTYNPIDLLNNQDLKRPAWEDLKKFKRKLDEIS